MNLHDALTSLKELADQGAAATRVLAELDVQTEAVYHLTDERDRLVAELALADAAARNPHPAPRRDAAPELARTGT